MFRLIPFKKLIDTSAIDQKQIESTEKEEEKQIGTLKMLFTQKQEIIQIKIMLNNRDYQVLISSKKKKNT